MMAVLGHEWMLLSACQAPLVLQSSVAMFKSWTASTATIAEQALLCLVLKPCFVWQPHDHHRRHKHHSLKLLALIRPRSLYLFLLGLLLLVLTALVMMLAKRSARCPMTRREILLVPVSFFRCAT